jgi:hypothetical protein
VIILAHVEIGPPAGAASVPVGAWRAHSLA